MLSHHLIKNIPASVSQMSPFSMNGLPSPGYQCPTSVYQAAPQQVYSLSQTGQQVALNKPVKSCKLSTASANIT